jgi:SAM-dependent methyltransferase
MSQEPGEVRQRVKSLSAQASQEGRPTAWFEELYALAGGDPAQVPWADMQPNCHAVPLLDSLGAGRGREALVVGCGLGHDAEDLALRGWKVIAFDLSPTAIEWAVRLHPESRVDYVVADAAHPTAEWKDRFDLIHEIHTLQTLPDDLRERVCQSICFCLKPGGSLLVGCRGRDEGDHPRTMPMPLPKSALDSFVQLGLQEVNFQDFIDESEGDGTMRFQALYFKPPA